MQKHWTSKPTQLTDQNEAILEMNYNTQAQWSNDYEKHHTNYNSEKLQILLKTITHKVFAFRESSSQGQVRKSGAVFSI